MRRTADEAAATRQALIETGVRTLARAGYRAATLAEIATEAGLTRGALYHHFRDKASLMEAIFHEFTSMMDRSVEHLLNLRAPVSEHLRAIIVGPLEAMERSTSLAAFLELVLLRLPDLPELRSLRAERRSQVAAQMELLTNIIASGVESGELQEVDPNAAAGYLVALQTGLIVSWIEFGRSYSITERARQAADLYTRSVA